MSLTESMMSKEDLRGALATAVKVANEREAELSRLRDLVREMRDALEYYADFKSNTGHDGEYIVYLGCGRYQNDGGTRASESIAKADAALKESGEPVKYGCMLPGFSDTSCVLDNIDCVTDENGNRRCVLERGRPITDKAICPHWRPIK